MTAFRPAWFVTAALLAVPAVAEEVVMLQDVQAQAPSQLSRDDLLALMSGARMKRINEKGSTHLWTNEPGGEMTVSSDNGGGLAKSSTAKGKWSISEDGRYCLNIQWKRESEESCRFILKTADGYFAVNALEPGSQKAYKLTITR